MPEKSRGADLTKSSKNSPTSSGSEMNCKRNLNGSGGRRESCMLLEKTGRGSL